jgi:membrane fusion protein (multidrug efflux system)
VRPPPVLTKQIYNPTIMSTASSNPSAALPAERTAPAARRSIMKPILLGIIALGVVAWLAQIGLHVYRFEKTDNAYIVGHIHQISPQIDAQVLTVLVQDNQKVKAGDVLIRLDPREFEIAVQKARAALAQAQAQQTQAAAAIAQTGAQSAEAAAHVVQAQAQIEETNAQVELAKINAARSEKLLTSNGAVPQADVDNTRSALQVSAAAQSAARANLVASQAGVRSAESTQAASRAQATAAAASVSAATANLHDAERKLAYAVITAPADGRVGNRAVEVGNRVQAGQTLLALAEPQVWVVANFKETQLTRMSAKTPVEMTIDALPGETLHGMIDSFAPASGAQFALLPPDNATGNFNKVVQRVPVKITFDPADVARLGDRLRLGFSVVVDVRVR